MHFFCFIAYTYLGVYVLYNNHKSILNKSIFVIIICFTLWNFVDIFPPEYLIKNDLVKIFYNISFIGCICFSSALLYFSLYFTKRQKILNSTFFKFILGLIPLFFIYLQWTNNLAVYHFHENYKWFYSAWANPPLGNLFYTYFILYSFFSLYFIIRYRKTTEKLYEKKQTKLISYALVVCFIIGLFTDLIIQEAFIREIPELGNITFLIFAIFLVYSIIKYKFLIFTPALAAENIISSMDELLIIINNEGNIHTVNKMVTDILKYDQKELKGKSTIA